MNSEIVWVDGDTDYLHVIFRKYQPDSTHYYHFPGEITFPKIVKWTDIEPVRKHSAQIEGKDYTILLSRIHFWGLVLWINPPPTTQDNDSRPVCVFDKNVHTPYIHMPDCDHVQDTVKGTSNLSPFEKLQWYIAISYFAAKLPSVSSRNPQPYPAILQEIKQEAIADPNQRFDLSSILKATHYLILVGRKSEISSVREAIVDSSGDITTVSLESFLRQVGVG